MTDPRGVPPPDPFRVVPMDNSYGLSGWRVQRYSFSLGYYYYANDRWYLTRWGATFVAKRLQRAWEKEYGD